MQVKFTPVTLSSAYKAKAPAAPLRFGHEEKPAPKDSGLRSAMASAIRKYPGWSLFISLLIGLSAVEGCNKVVDNLTQPKAEHAEKVNP